MHQLRLPGAEPSTPQLAQLTAGVTPVLDVVVVVIADDGVGRGVGDSAPPHLHAASEPPRHTPFEHDDTTEH